MDERICYLQKKGIFFNTTTDHAKRKIKPLRLHFMVYWIGLEEEIPKYDNKIAIGKF
jgi:hypothetical protein